MVAKTQANAKLTAGVAAFCLAASVFAGNDLAALTERPTGEPQEFRLGSICVAGRNTAWVSRTDTVGL